MLQTYIPDDSRNGSADSTLYSRSILVPGKHEAVAQETGWAQLAPTLEAHSCPADPWGMLPLPTCSIMLCRYAPRPDSNIGDTSLPWIPTNVFHWSRLLVWGGIGASDGVGGATSDVRAWRARVRIYTPTILPGPAIGQPVGSATQRQKWVDTFPNRDLKQNSAGAKVSGVDWDVAELVLA